MDDEMKDLLQMLATRIIVDAFARGDNGEYQPLTAQELHDSIYKFVEEYKGS